MSKRKDPAAVKLGRRGGRAKWKDRTPEERQRMIDVASDARWTGHEYSQKPGSAYQRERRARMKAEQESK